MQIRSAVVLLAAPLSLALAIPSTELASSATRIVAIGDIHGSADGLLAILNASGLVDRGGRWSGGEALLVQTGDYTDRGDQVRQVLDLLMRLETEAPRAGGRAQILLGNHEVMNLLHEFRDVSPSAFAAFADARSADRQARAYKQYAEILKRRGVIPISEQEWLAAHPAGFVEYTEALAPRGRYGRWLRARKVAVNENGTIFMHAGLSADIDGSLDDVNQSVSQEIDHWDRTRDILVEAGLIRPFFTLQETLDAIVAELQRIALALKERRLPGDHVSRTFARDLRRAAQIWKSPLLAAEGPLWFRGFALWPEEEAPKITDLLQRFKASRFVSGHTPMLKGRIMSRFDNRVFLIDTGMLASHYKGGQPSALEIAGDTVTAIYTSGREPLLAPAGSKAAH